MRASQLKKQMEDVKLKKKILFILDISKIIPSLKNEN